MRRLHSPRGAPWRALTALGSFCDHLNGAVGAALAWLVLAMTLAQCAVVLLRYVFSAGSVPLQESVWYLHGLLFTLGAGYALLHDRHVRVDLFYRGAPARLRAASDLLAAALVLTLCTLTAWLAWPYVARAWRVW